jgi:hypothetical protein
MVKKSRHCAVFQFFDEVPLKPPHPRQCRRKESRSNGSPVFVGVRLGARGPDNRFYVRLDRPAMGREEPSMPARFIPAMRSPPEHAQRATPLLYHRGPMSCQESCEIPLILAPDLELRGLHTARGSVGALHRTVFGRIQSVE